MSGVMRSQFTEAQKKDSYKYFWERYTEVAPVHEQLFDIMPSNAAYEQLTSAIGLGELLEKPEGEDIQFDAPMESYTIVIKNRTFARGTRFTYESVQDTQKMGNLLRDTVGSWGAKYVETKDKFFAKFFNYGAYTAGQAVFNNSITGVITDSSGDKIYDGQPLFSTAHPDKVGNTYSNFSASNSLSTANLRTVYSTYTSTNNRDERGAIIDLTPETLLIPPALQFTAREILETTLIPSSMDNTINVLKAILTPLVWAQLSDTDGWFILRKKMGLVGLSRENPSIDFWQDETNFDYFASIKCRYGGAVTQWRGIYANNLSTS